MNKLKSTHLSHILFIKFLGIYFRMSNPAERSKAAVKYKYRNHRPLNAVGSGTG
jgi:hypothetical protein